MTPPAAMTGYQKSVVAILAFLHFTLVLDFMILSPLGAFLLDELHVDTAEFGLVVSAYAFSAGLSGILTAGFADKFDRKKLLLIFYAGFIVGTFLCGVAPTYPLLLGARIVTGLFGGVLGGITMAIIADLFPLHMRGRVMGVVQASFAASQVLGIPVGLALANLWGWHAPFLLIAAVGGACGVVIALVLRPVDEHLRTPREGKTSALAHLLGTFSKLSYLRAYGATVLLATGGFMMAPFSSAFMVNNLKIDAHDLPMVFVASGVVALFTGPAVGRLADRFGKFPLFLVGSLAGGAVVLFYTHLGPSPIWVVIAVSIAMFAAISARMVAASALTSAVPAPQDRGAFMAINSSIQQVSGGIAAALGGVIVYQAADGHIEHFDILGFVVTGAMLVTLTPMWIIARDLRRASAAATP